MRNTIIVATMNKDAFIKLVNEQMWAKTDADVPSFKAGDTITVSYESSRVARSACRVSAA